MKRTIFCLLALFIGLQIASAQTTRTRFINHTNGPGIKPQIGDFVDLHVYVFFGDSIVQTSRQTGKPARFQLPSLEQAGGRVMPAIVEGILLCAVGDSISTYENIDSLTQALPPMFYGSQEIRMDIVLVRHIPLLEMEKQRELDKIEAEKQRVRDSTANKGNFDRAPSMKAAVTKMAERLRNNEFEKDLKTTASGLQYLIFSEGKGSKLLKGETKVKVHYYGCLMDGTHFDDSFSRGEPYEVHVGMGQVIPGWDEGLLLLNHGAMALLKIPGDLAYGPHGGGPLIPADATLVFYIEVE